MTMEIANLILTLVSTLAAVVSAYAAVSAKKEVAHLKSQISGNNNFQNTGEIQVKNTGENKGIQIGVNSGEVHK